MKNDIMIIAGEASGDLHGANLVRAMKKMAPDLKFFGMGGVELASAGVELLFDAQKIAVVGVIEVLAHLSDILSAQRILRKRMRESRPALLILIDFPDFNFLLARKAKKLGIPIFYYISPQVWAWRSGRVKTIAKLVDNIGVILPFEEKFYRDRGVPAHYVGHPLLDTVKVKMDRKTFCEKHGIPQSKRMVGILPGSRRKELASLLPTFLQAMEKVQQQSEEDLLFLLPLASTLKERDLRENGLDTYYDIEVRILLEDRYEMMSCCDAVVAASGTVTLELALLETPMVVAYKVSPATYFLGRLLVKGKCFSLVNLIADEPFVPEFLQNEANPDNIAKEIARLLFDENAKKTMKNSFFSLNNKLGTAGASQQAAELALLTLNSGTT